MRPGFNHNIRHLKWVFHVQTEDNGLALPYLVTQVFIGGHVLALERTSYQDILEENLAEEARNDAITSRMQTQHKRLLKSVVEGVYDEAMRLRESSDTPSQDVLTEDMETSTEDIGKSDDLVMLKGLPREFYLESLLLPIAPASEIELTFLGADNLPLAPICPEEFTELSDSFVALREAVEETDRGEEKTELLDENDIRAELSELQRADTLAIPSPFLTDVEKVTADLSSARGGTTTPPPEDSRVPVTASATTTAGGSRTIVKRIVRARSSKARPTTNRTIRQSSRSPSDTMLDFGAPAALREELRKRIRQATGQSDGHQDKGTAVVRRSSSTSRGHTHQSGRELHKANSPRTQVVRREGAKSKSEILVSEPSLDEVLLGYLKDD